MAATTTLLGLVTPTQGTLSGTWGDTVNYGISDYLDIAIAGTLSFAGDGAITLANTTGSASGNAITTTTAQYMVIRITGTQTVTKVITAPSYSKLYMVDHAGATSTVTFKAAAQTGVSVAVGEKCFVYYNGTDYVKVASSVTGVTSFTAGTTGLTPSTATTGAVTLAGTLAIANGGTGTTSTTFANLATNVTGTLPVANGGTGIATTTAYGVVFAGTTATGPFQAAAGPGTATHVLTSNGTGALPTFQAPAGAGNLTGAVTSVGLATSLGSFSSANLLAALTDETGSGSAVFATSPTLVTPLLGTPTSGVLSACTVDGTNKVGYLNIPNSGAKTTSYTLVAGDVGKFIELGTSGTVVVPASVFAAGDAISIFNNTSASISCTCSAVTDVYKGGTDADISTFSVTTRGVATILFITATRAVVTGNLA